MRRWVTRGYLAWLAASVVSSLGSGVVGFALTWTASGLGGGVAGTLAAVGLVPTVLLLLLSGTLGDRWGQRRMVLAVTLASMVQYLAFFLLLGTRVPLLWLLVGNAVVSGTLQGIGSPSAAVFSRQLVAPGDVRAAVTVSSTVATSLRALSPSIGALVLAWVGLRGALLVNVASFAGVVLVLLRVRLRAPEPVRSRGPLLRDAADGLTSVLRDRAGRAFLAATALLAAAILPVTGLGLPLLARTRGWGVGAAALLEGAWLVGSLAAQLLVTARVARRPDATLRGAWATPAVAGAGVLVLALAPAPGVGGAACLGMGAAVAVFGTQAGAAFVAATPSHLLSRWSAVLTLTQFVPLVLAHPMLGFGVQLVGVVPTFGALALLAAGASAAYRSGSIGSRS